MSDNNIFIGVASGNSLSGAALACVRREGQIFRVLVLRSVAHNDVAGAVASLRREIAASVTPEPEPAFVRERPADSSREKYVAMGQDRQREAQRVARRELELERVGSRFVVRSDGEPDMPHVWALMRQEVVRTATRDAQEPLMWVRRALENDASVGCYGLALARAVAAASAASGG